MSVTIGSNIISLMAQRRINTAASELETIFERLASGQRINRPSDDAAGLAIADSLRADTRVYTQGVKNLSDGFSFLSIAEGALKELSSLVTRQLELAEQSANGVYSAEQRRALDSELTALTKEYNRIALSTKFNGISIFDQSSRDLRLQAGYGVDESIKVGVGTEFSRAVADGSFQDAIRQYNANGFEYADQLYDFDGDGNLDVAFSTSAGTRIMYGNTDGTFGAMVTLGGSYRVGLYLQDIDGNGNLDIISHASGQISVYLNNGDRTFHEVNTSISGDFGRNSFQADFDNDGKMDLLLYNSTTGVDYILRGNGDGTFSTAETAFTSNPTITERYAMGVGDFDGDGNVDYSVKIWGTVFIMKGNGDGTFQEGAASGSWTVDGSRTTARIGFADFNDDGILDYAFQSTTGRVYTLTGNGDGSFGGPQAVGPVGSGRVGGTIVDLNGDGILDIIQANGSSVTALLGNGDGTFTIGQSTAITNSGVGTVMTGDLNKDGAIDVITFDGPGGGNTGIHTLLSNLTYTPTQELIHIRTQAEARAALEKLRNYQGRIGLELGAIGAHQSRLQSATNNLKTTSENYQKAESMIRDADIAEEATKLIAKQILQQTGAQVLKMANLQPQLVLRLINSND